MFTILNGCIFKSNLLGSGVVIKTYILKILIKILTKAQHDVLKVKEVW